MRVLADQSTIERTIRRLSYEIIEKNKNLNDVVILGIETRGVEIGQRITQAIFDIEGVHVVNASLNTKPYRDDLKTDLEKQLPDVEVNQKIVILVDDVLYTGRTIRAAMDAVIDIGRPEKIQLAVLVDRGHREFPIQATYVGKNIPTAKSETIKVRLKSLDGDESIVIE